MKLFDLFFCHLCAIPLFYFFIYMFWNKKSVFCIFKLGIFKFQYVAKYRTLAREVAHSIREPREVSDVDVIHEHHTGEC